jgi:hypothetical protein
VIGDPCGDVADGRDSTVTCFANAESASPEAENQIFSAAVYAKWKTCWSNADRYRKLIHTHTDTSQGVHSLLPAAEPESP